MVKLMCIAIFCVCQPSSGDEAVLFERVRMRVSVKNWNDKLIGFGCDGATVNVAANGLRGILEGFSLDSLFLVSGSPLRIVYSGCLKK